MMRGMRKLLMILAACAAASTLFAQSAGEGYAKKIKATPLLKTETTVAGQPIVYPTSAHPEVTAVLVEIPVGAETGWHKHPVPCYGYVIAGQLTVQMEGGKANEFQAGDALAESVNVLHNGKNTGTEPVKIVMFALGEKDHPFTVPGTAPQ